MHRLEGVPVHSKDPNRCTLPGWAGLLAVEARVWGCLESLDRKSDL